LLTSIVIVVRVRPLEGLLVWLEQVECQFFDNQRKGPFQSRQAGVSDGRPARIIET
jgi:hypothetical protein